MMLKIVNFLDSIKPDILSLISAEEDRADILGLTEILTANFVH